MAVLAGVDPETGQRAGEGRLSWPVFLLMLATVTSSSLSALSLYQMVALRSEVEGLKLEVGRRRGEGQEARYRGQSGSSRRSSQETLHHSGSEHAFSLIRKRRTSPGNETFVSQPCLQLLANSSRKPFRRGIPWQSGLKRGSALEKNSDGMLVKEEGFYFVYSQVYYMDSTFAMGHVVIRWKKNVVGDERKFVFLFRCIQTMNPEYAFNTCYTGGIVKLEVDDYLELLIPRPAANVSLDGDSTFLGAFKLA
ncbi:tumor necrosis factor ligand superfamily member 13B isoform X2 [Stegastes partitus]|uniref:Tumor necrosis factor ligand superfamily member 13B isoform X2 n=1 Tax=Stegastes partitus TaxID=144197 RepID=A0A9Y4TX28_9TELE|nr:PREDICTED: tumor necrosis factor ligand superfamily member 13B isoform X2 [Stegastes partitus]